MPEKVPDRRTDGQSGDYYASTFGQHKNHVYEILRLSILRQTFLMFYVCYNCNLTLSYLSIALCKYCSTKRATRKNKQWHVIKTQLQQTGSLSILNTRRYEFRNIRVCQWGKAMKISLFLSPWRVFWKQSKWTFIVFKSVTYFSCF